MERYCEVIVVNHSWNL